MVENGRRVTYYFVDDESSSDILPPTVDEALSLAGAWSDLDWDEMYEALDRIRHESEPTPPIDDFVPPPQKDHLMVRHTSAAARSTAVPLIADTEDRRDQNDAVIRRLDEWLADESGYDEETWPRLREALDCERERVGARELFRE